METTARWIMLGSSYCGISHGNIILLFSGVDDSEYNRFGIGFSFDGVTLPQMPVTQSELDFECPRLNKSLKSHFSLQYMKDGQEAQAVEVARGGASGRKGEERRTGGGH
jgi:hypothetical protein